MRRPARFVYSSEPALPRHDMSTVRSWLVLCSAAALAASSAAQQPVFRAGTDYVRVDVVVTDKNDRPITDLRKEDFEIVERDRAQTIEDFEFVSVPVTPRALQIDRAARRHQPTSRRIPRRPSRAGCS